MNPIFILSCADATEPERTSIAMASQYFTQSLRLCY
jgi:hypothetical protein